MFLYISIYCIMQHALSLKVNEYKNKGENRIRFFFKQRSRFRNVHSSWSLLLRKIYKMVRTQMPQYWDRNLTLQSCNKIKNQKKKTFLKTLNQFLKIAESAMHILFCVIIPVDYEYEQFQIIFSLFSDLTLVSISSLK